MRTIDHLGRIGDVVSVKPGYARNYLMPLGYGVSVTKANIQLLERERARGLAEEQVRLSDLKSYSEELSKTSVTITGRANEDGHLFGSVNAAQIAVALREKGLQIEEKAVLLKHPLKEIGVFEKKEKKCG